MGRKRRARRIAKKVHEEANEQRGLRGAPKLAGETELMMTAETHSRMMAKAREVGHYNDGPVRGYARTFDNCTVVPTRSRSSREIANRAVQDWLDSDLHRQNLLSVERSYDGVGVWLTDNAAYITHRLANRKSIFNTLFGYRSA